MTKKELRKRKKDLIEQLSLAQASRLLLDDKKSWTKGAAARDAQGDETHCDGDAASWCSVGAICAFGKVTDAGYAVETRLDNIVPGGSIVSYNDVKRRRHSEVLAKFDRVIKELSQEIDALPV